jgi:hypothetical protein
MDDARELGQRQDPEKFYDYTFIKKIRLNGASIVYSNALLVFASPIHKGSALRLIKTIESKKKSQGKFLIHNV